MSKLSAVEGKLSRIHEQIEAAQNEMERIDGEIEGIEQELTAQLSKIKPNDEAVVSLEGKRSELTTARARLQARVGALQDTIPGMEAALNEAVLTEEIAAQEKLVKQINEAVKRWTVKAQEVADLAAIAADIRTQRKTLIDTAGHIRYLSAVTGAAGPELSGASHVSNEASASLKEALRHAIRTEGDPYYVSPWDEKADALARSKKRTAVKV